MQQTAALARGLASPPPPPKPPLSGLGRYAFEAVGVAAIVALIVFLVLFQWNWLRGPLARAISARIHRPVAIAGNLEVHPWSWSPSATVNGLIIGNAPWAGPKPLATLPRLTVRVKILPLIGGKLVLPLVEADRPDVDLLRDRQGRANWVFSPGGPPKPLKLPAINNLIIREGAVRYLDQGRKLSFTGTVSSNQQVALHGGGVFVLRGNGTLNQLPFSAFVTGGPLIDVDPARPYSFQGRVQAGETHAELTGRIDHPFDFSGLSGQFTLSGQDLAEVYGLTGLALPNTPPYRLAADFTRHGQVYALTHLRGVVGRSDLGGSLTVDDTSGRPFLTANLSSRLVRLADLSAVVGGAPRHKAGQVLSPSQKVEGARLAAEHRFLPDAHLDVTRVRGMDARLHYRADSVDAGRMPIRALGIDLTLDHGVLDIDPLDMTLPQGRLAGTLRIDARRDTPSDAIDLRLTNAQLEHLVVARSGAAPPLLGGLYARVRLTGRGDSVRAVAGSANGEATLVVPSGAIRQAFAELMGIDAVKGLYLLLSKNQSDTPIRCGVADFQARDGILTLTRGVLDTGPVTVDATGDVDLRAETLNLRLRGHPKKFQILRIRAPITVTGPMVQPKVGVDLAKAAPQLALGVAVGVFAAPAAAILPFVHPGLAKNADCSALVAQASQQGVHVKGPPRQR